MYNCQAHSEIMKITMITTALLYILYVKLTKQAIHM
jgi:hypothetical protein